MKKRNGMVSRIISSLMNKPKGQEPETQRAAEFLAGLKSFSKYKRLFKGIVGAWTRKDFAKGRIVQYPIKPRRWRDGARSRRRAGLQEFFCKAAHGRPAEFYENALNDLHNRMNPNTGWR